MDSLTFPAETLLFQPPTIQRTINAIGELTWTVRYRFTFKPNKDKGGTPRGWNWYFRAKDGAGEEGDFEAMYNVGGNQYKQFPTDDFTRI